MQWDQLLDLNCLFLKYNLEYSKRTWDLKCFDMCFLLNTLLNKYVLIIKLQDHHFFEVIVSLSLLNKVTLTQSSASPSFWIIRNVVPRKSLLKAFFIKVHATKNKCDWDFVVTETQRSVGRFRPLFFPRMDDDVQILIQFEDKIILRFKDWTWKNPCCY